MSENGRPEASTNARNLHQRVCDIKKEVQVKWTGKTAQNQKEGAALSIADVDKALGDLMGQHGVYTTYTFNQEPRRLENGRDWRVFIRGFLVNADDPIRRGGEGGAITAGDYDQADLYDDGSSISAAVSFALKRWQREVFKLAEDDTSASSTAQAPRSDFTPPREARQETPPPPRPAPSGPQLSAAQLADRSALYETAERLGKTREEAEAWVNTLLDTPQPNGDTVSLASIRRKLDAEEGKQRAKQGAAAKPSEPQDAAKEAEPTKDPAALVCPYCGNADAPGDIAAEPGRMRCWTGKGGCSKSFEAQDRPSREDFDRYKASMAEPSQLERKVDEAGVRPAAS